MLLEACTTVSRQQIDATHMQRAQSVLLHHVLDSDWRQALSWEASSPTYIVEALSTALRQPELHLCNLQMTARTQPLQA